jgi:hypothetical protein
VPARFIQSLSHPLYQRLESYLWVTASVLSTAPLFLPAPVPPWLLHLSWLWLLLMLRQMLFIYPELLVLQLCQFETWLLLGNGTQRAVYDSLRYLRWPNLTLMSSPLKLDSGFCIFYPGVGPLHDWTRQYMGHEPSLFHTLCHLAGLAASTCQRKTEYRSVTQVSRRVSCHRTARIRPQMDRLSGPL